jgi:hypothetical protein
VTGIAGVLSAAPAVALESVPAIAAAAAHPDAELIALGREIEAFLPRYVIVSLESWVRGWRSYALAHERSGIAKPETEDEFARVDAAHKAASAELQCDAWDNAYLQLSPEDDRLTKAVRALPATTPEGLRVKALSVALANIILIAHDPDGMDYVEEIARDLTMSVLVSLGIQCPSSGFLGQRAAQIKGGSGSSG